MSWYTRMPERPAAELASGEELVDLEAAVWEGSVDGFVYSDDEVWASAQSVEAWRQMRAQQEAA